MPSSADYPAGARSPALAARLALIAAAVLFSTGGAAIKAAAFTSWQVASFRSAIAAVAILLLVPGARVRWPRLTPLAGLAYAGTLLSFVLATKLTTAANAIFLQSAAPLYLFVLGPLLLKERLRRREVVFLVPMAAGMLLFFLGVDPPQATAPQPLAGNLLGAVSGIFWALTVAGLRWMTSTPGGHGAGMATVAAGNLFAFLLALPMALQSPAADLRSWLVVAYLGIFQIGLAYYLLTWGVKRVRALEASMILLVEPALNPVWAFLAQGERPGNLALLGGVLILASTAAMMLRRGGN